jgi:hypothetical protein
MRCRAKPGVRLKMQCTEGGQPAKLPHSALTSARGLRILLVNGIVEQAQAAVIIDAATLLAGLEVEPLKAGKVPHVCRPQRPH